MGRKSRKNGLFGRFWPFLVVFVHFDYEAFNYSTMIMINTNRCKENSDLAGGNFLGVLKIDDRL